MNISLPHKVLIIDTDEINCNATRNKLTPYYNVSIATTEEQGYQLAMSEMPHLILINLQMPNKLALTMCRNIRSDIRTKHIPLLVLSEQVELQEKVLAFQNGADDVILKTIEIEELLVRIDSKIMRFIEYMNSDFKSIITCGNLELNPITMEVLINKQIVELGHVEYKLLKFLLEKMPSVQSRDQILSSVWRDTFVLGRTINVHILSLRRKLKNFDHSIETLYGVGYTIKDKKLLNLKTFIGEKDIWDTKP
ncbi:MAG: response regulator transcription factor [Oligoflexia bacterium]|nr:response regulator transcription factor [Oligoflexia bacterium]